MGHLPASKSIKMTLGHYFIPIIYPGRDNPYRYNYVGGVQGQQLNQLNSISSPGVSFPAVSGHEDIMFAPKW